MDRLIYVLLMFLGVGVFWWYAAFLTRGKGKHRATRKDRA